MPKFYGKGNRILIPALPGISIDGAPYLSAAAQHRVDRAMQEYLYPSFRSDEEGTILIMGGLDRNFPSIKSGAKLMGEYAVHQYGISQSSILIEGESTDTEEGFAFSFKKFQDFYKGIKSGDRQLGVASHPEHLKEVMEMGSKALGLYGNWLRPLPTWQYDSEIGEKVVSNFAEQRHVEELAMVAD